MASPGYCRGVKSLGPAGLVAGLALVIGCSPRFPPPGRSADLSGGFVVEHRYDRNALVASAVAGRFVVALTEAGSVLRFDRKTMALDGEHWPARRAVALSRADEQGMVLVGFSSGHLARLDPARLALTPVGQVPGQPAFIVRDPGSARIVVVFGKPIAGPYGWARRGLHQYRARALDRAWETPIEQPSTLLVDRRRRLWLGSDHGEWGGGIQLLELSTGRITEVPWGGSGVYGFTERPDGDVWGFGGTSHMGASSGYVARVRPGQKPHVLYSRELMFGLSEENPTARALVGKQPVGPISHIVAPGAGDRLLVVSEDEVFETDVRMKGWKRLAAPALDVPGGRPDAVGSYPGIRSTTLTDGKLLLTTVRDGLTTLDPTTGELRSHRLAGQLAMRPESLPLPVSGKRAQTQPLELQLDGRPVGVSDALAIDPDHVLIATGSALVSYEVSAGRVSPLRVAGLDGEAHRLARDGAGRIRIAGRGLWLLDGSRAIPVRTAVPAVVDTEVRTLVARDDRLYLALEERGTAGAGCGRAGGRGAGRAVAPGRSGPRPRAPRGEAGRSGGVRRSPLPGGLAREPELGRALRRGPGQAARGPGLSAPPGGAGRRWIGASLVDPLHRRRRPGRVRRGGGAPQRGAVGARRGQVAARATGRARATDQADTRGREP